MTRPGNNFRTALLLAFGGLLSLLLIAGWEALSSVRKIHAEEEAARHAFLARNECILTVRSTLDVYGNLVQRYFLSYNPGVHASAAKEFPALFGRIHSELAKYPPDRKPEEQSMLAALKSLLSDQEKLLGVAVSDDRQAERGRMSRLYEELLPRNEGILLATEKITHWNQNQLSARDAAMAASFGGLQTNLTRLLIVILASGLALSLGSIAYIARQDREARERYVELAENRNALSQLSARLRDAQEEERRSISRELHDELGQSLGALLVDLGQLSSLVPSEDAQAQGALAKIKAVTQQSVDSIRNMALLLRPSMLDDLGLVPALEWQAREVSRRSEMEVEIAAKGVPENLDEKYRICIYRLAQEALNNAARHSGARHAWVDLEGSARGISIAIRDDGRGFDPARSRGLGLLGMDERVRHLGGSLRVDSKPDHGTVVTAAFP